MSMNKKTTVRGGKPVNRAAVHAKKRHHKRKRRSVVPAVALFTICAVALIVMIATLSRPD